MEIQQLYNRLYAEIARDTEFLDKVMGGSVSKVDEFQGELWRCWKECRDELVQVRSHAIRHLKYFLPSSCLSLSF